jgi:hypothetical protein
MVDDLLQQWPLVEMGPGLRDDDVEGSFDPLSARPSSLWNFSRWMQGGDGQRNSLMEIANDRIPIGTDGCSFGEPFVHSRNSDRPAVCSLNDDV